MEFPLSQDEARKVMKVRGYTEVSVNMSGDVVSCVNFVKHLNEQIILHAKAELKKESLSLYFVDLKYLCELSAKNFAFHHKDFEKYEQIISMYAAKCLNMDVFAILDQLKGTITPPPEEEKIVKPKTDIAERKRKFWDDIKPIAKQRGWSYDQTRKFYDYWTEESKSGKKFRRENETYFDINKRMATFDRNDNERAQKNKSYQDRTAEKQNAETKQNKIIDKTKLF
jgi:hypothetical protein